MKQKTAELASRLSLACTCGATMYACAAGYGGYVLLRTTSAPKGIWGVILGIPAIATILFLVASLALPNLLAPKRIVFPLNVTLPPVFGALVLLTVMLFTSTGSSLVLPYDRVKAAMFWANPWVLVLVTLSQILCLTGLAMLKGEPAE